MNCCVKCHKDADNGHTEEGCLRIQLAEVIESRDAWKEAWHKQRESTGRVAWQWQADWMIPHLESHLRSKLPALADLEKYASLSLKDHRFYKGMSDALDQLQKRHGDK